MLLISNVCVPVEIIDYTKMYGDLANKLMIETKRSTFLSELPIYLHELVKDIVQEVSDLDKDVTYLTEQQERASDIEDEDAKQINQCQIFATHLSMRRNKQCLLVYEKLRAEKIDRLCWLNIDPFIGSELKGNENSNHESKSLSAKTLMMENLSHPEQDYYKQYQELALDFKAGFSDIDLSVDLEPPKDLFIDVRVLKNGGEVQTEYGSFNLIKDSQFYVRKSDVDRLIQLGYLEEI